MAPTERDRLRLRAQVRDLETVEQSDIPSARGLRSAIDRANIVREAAGNPPLDEHPEPPEVELYRRARALGLR